MKQVNWEAVCLRRAKFLRDEAREPEPVRDQTVTYALRVISNWATVGKDAGSAAIKWNNPRISKKAWELYESCSDREWEKQTINEHPEPIAQVWKWIVDHCDKIEPADILARAKKYPMVTVSKEEDAELGRQGFRSQGSPEERYASIPLEERAEPPTKRTGKESSRG